MAITELAGNFRPDCGKGGAFYFVRVRIDETQHGSTGEPDSIKFRKEWRLLGSPVYFGQILERLARYGFKGLSR